MKLFSKIKRLRNLMRILSTEKTFAADITTEFGHIFLPPMTFKRLMTQIFTEIGIDNTVTEIAIGCNPETIEKISRIVSPPPTFEEITKASDTLKDHQQYQQKHFRFDFWFFLILALVILGTLGRLFYLINF